MRGCFYYKRKTRKSRVILYRKLRCISQLHARDAGNTLDFLCHAVEHVGFGHGTLVMRHHDEQGLLAEFAEQRHETAHVSVIERAVDFVQHAVRRRLFHVNGKQQSRCSQGVFTTGKRLDTAHLLTRRAHVDFDVGVEDIHGLAHFVHLLDKTNWKFFWMRANVSR